MTAMAKTSENLASLNQKDIFILTISRNVLRLSISILKSNPVVEALQWILRWLGFQSFYKRSGSRRLQIPVTLGLLYFLDHCVVGNKPEIKLTKRPRAWESELTIQYHPVTAGFRFDLTSHQILILKI